MNRILTLAAAGLMSLGLVACGRDEAPADAAAATATPEAAVKSAAQALRTNDVGQFVKLALPAAQYDEVKAKFESRERPTPAAAEAAEFREMMQKFTAPDAETALMAEFEPHLAQFEAEMAPQMPMMIGMGTGFAKQAVQQNADMNEDQKRQATQFVDAVGGWLASVKLTDRELAKSAIAKAVAAARRLELTELEQVNALSFEQAMAKAGILFGGFKDVLAVYGFDIDKSLDSTQVEVLKQEADSARVKVSYQVLGQTIVGEQDMVRQQERWYGKDTMKAVSEALAKQSAPAMDAGMDDDSAEEDMGAEQDEAEEAAAE
jgi:hypothetical protein